jgi:hypothetical protein
MTHPPSAAGIVGSSYAPRMHRSRIGVFLIDHPEESYDVAAASVVEERDGYTILADPGGMVFCVVPVQSGDHFARHATTWR